MTHVCAVLMRDLYRKMGLALKEGMLGRLVHITHVWIFGESNGSVVWYSTAVLGAYRQE